MPSLARLWASRHLGGRPIEIPFRQLAELVSVRTGELVIIAGDAGGGKSTLALNWAWRTKDPVLYLALEDPEGVKDRLTAFATHQTLTLLGAALKLLRLSTAVELARTASPSTPSYTPMDDVGSIRCR